MGKTTIVLSRKTHDALQSLGRKGETFDQLVMELVEQRILSSKALRTENKGKAAVANQDEPSESPAAASVSLPTEEEEDGSRQCLIRIPRR